MSGEGWRCWEKKVSQWEKVAVSKFCLKLASKYFMAGMGVEYLLKFSTRGGFL